MRRRIPALIVLAVAVGAFALFGPKVPRDQTVRFSLGEYAPLVREMVVRYRPDPGKPRGSQDLTEDVVREVSFRYPLGDAPRVVRHEPRLADGEYLLEIELLTQSSRATVQKTVDLSGSAVSIDVASSLARVSDGGAP